MTSPFSLEAIIARLAGRYAHVYGESQRLADTSGLACMAVRDTAQTYRAALHEVVDNDPAGVAALVDGYTTLVTLWQEARFEGRDVDIDRWATDTARNTIAALGQSNPPETLQ